MDENCQHATNATIAAFNAEVELVKAESSCESALKIFEIAESMDADAALRVNITNKKVMHAQKNGSLDAVLLKELQVANATLLQTRTNVAHSYNVLQNAQAVLEGVRARA